MEEQFAAQSIAHFLENHMSSGARKIEAIADGPKCFLDWSLDLSKKKGASGAFLDKSWSF